MKNQLKKIKKVITAHSTENPVIFLVSEKLKELKFERCLSFSLVGSRI